VTSSRNCIALLLLAMLCLAGSLLLWAIVFPLCFAFSLAIIIAGVVDKESEVCLPEVVALLPARAPPTVS
jgi:hypothetical protein